MEVIADDTDTGGFQALPCKGHRRIASTPAGGKDDFFNFYFVKLGWVSPPAGVGQHDFYQMATLLFADKFYAILYVVLMIFLGFHMHHAFQSAFQTLGLNHTKYTPFIKAVGTLYAIAVPLGFAIIPLFFIFIK